MIKPGRIIFEMEGVDHAAQRAMELAAAKLPIKTKFITRHDQEGGSIWAKLDKVLCSRAKS